MIRLTRGLTCLWLAATVIIAGMSASAQDRADNSHDPVVVELYTSQGCSSCPPADEILKEVSHRDDVIALALHVDYWDYIGWEDKFAQAKFTKRQQGYASAAGARTIYTPQMIVAGKDHIIGAHAMDLAEQIALHSKAGNTVALSLIRQGSSIEIFAEPVAGAGPDDLVVQLVRYDPLQQVTIGRGENSGRTIDYVNIVTSWEKVGTWRGDAPLNLSVDVPGKEPVVVIIQRDNQGAILAAARLR